MQDYSLAFFSHRFEDEIKNGKGEELKEGESQGVRKRHKLQYIIIKRVKISEWWIIVAYKDWERKY